MVNRTKSGTLRLLTQCTALLLYEYDLLVQRYSDSANDSVLY